MVPKLDEDKPDYNFIAYTQSIPDPMKYELAQLVIRNSNMRIRNMLELVEEELDDPFIPDKWIYHKNWGLNKVLHYIRNENDNLRKEDEIVAAFDYKFMIKAF